MVNRQKKGRYNYMNNVILIGRLATEVDLNYTPNTQTAKATFTLAVDRPRRDGADQTADFIRITVWGKQAETCNQWISKGKQVAVQGRIQTGSYKNRDGQTVYTTDIVADRVEFLQGNGGRAEQPKQEPKQEPKYRWEEEPPYAPAWNATNDSTPF